MTLSKAIGIRVLVATACIGLVLFVVAIRLSEKSAPINNQPGISDVDHKIEVLAPKRVYVPVATRPGASAWTFSIELISESAGTFIVGDVFVGDIAATNIGDHRPRNTRLPGDEGTDNYIILEPLTALKAGQYPVTIHIAFTPDNSSDTIPVIAETVFVIE